MKPRFYLFFFSLIFCCCKSKAQQTILPTTDTTIYFTNDHTCKMYVGFYIDDDEVEFLYDLKADSSCGISDCRLLLFDRWGNLLGEIKDTMLTYAVGYSHDPFRGTKEFYYKFSYKDQDGTEKKCVGMVHDPWW